MTYYSLNRFIEIFIFKRTHKNINRCPKCFRTWIEQQRNKAIPACKHKNPSSHGDIWIRDKEKIASPRNRRAKEKIVFTPTAPTQCPSILSNRRLQLGHFSTIFTHLLNNRRSPQTGQDLMNPLQSKERGLLDLRGN